MQSATADIQRLAERVEKLEVANRRWKSASSILLLFGVSMLLLSTRHAERVAAAAGADRPDAPVIRAGAVEAQEFVLKDTDGRVYARLSLNPLQRALAANGFSPNGRVFVLPNRNGAGDSAVLQFYDANGSVVWSAPTKPELMPVK